MYRLGSKLSGEMLIVISAAIAGVQPIFIKGLYALDMQPLDVLTWRFIIAVPAIWLLTLFAQGGRTAASDAPKPAPLPRRRLLLVGVFFSAVSAVGFIGLSLMPASTFLVLSYSFPAMVALIGLFLGERLMVRGWLALGLTLFGVVLTAPDFSAGLQDANVSRVAVAMLNAVAVAVYTVVVGRVLRGYNQGAQATAWMFSGTLVAFLVVAIVRGGLAIPPSFMAWVYLFVVGMLCTTLSFYALYSGMQKISASKTAVLGTVEVAFTLTSAALLLGERLLPVQVVGAVLIVMSIVLLQVPIPARWRLIRTQLPAAAPDSLG